MLQPKVVQDLRLRDFGYDPIPLDPKASYDELARRLAQGRGREDHLHVRRPQPGRGS
jgi:hypothetical protein